MPSDAKKIIIAPLNWGLGHATRCIPIIDYAIDQGYDILIASDGAALELLRIEYPSLKFTELPGYNILYQDKNMIWSMAKQLPQIRRAIQDEYYALRNILVDFKADLIISDNRYGCYNELCNSIILCHQINIPVARAVAPAVNHVHHYFLSRFNQVWIPDVEGPNNLTGDMTKNLGKLFTQFIGPLSRLRINKNIETKDQILAVLSGPEPQRTRLEKHLTDQLSKLNKKSILIKGLINGEEGTIINKINNLTIVNYLTSTRLGDLIQESQYLIARSGYSTIMDLIQLRRSALLIPTPAQPEQEYLARYLSDKKWMTSQQQTNINIEKYILNEKKIALPRFEGVGFNF